jgi:hypothetical protein
MSNTKNLIGMQIGKWYVHGISNKRSKNGKVYYNCLCDCGTKKEVK